MKDDQNLVISLESLGNELTSQDLENASKIFAKMAQDHNSSGQLAHGLHVKVHGKAFGKIG